MTDETQGADAPEAPEIPVTAVAGAKAELEPKLSDDSPKTWDKVLVVAGGSASISNEKRPVIIVEHRTDEGALGKGSYPSGADVYLASDFEYVAEPSEDATKPAVETLLDEGFPKSAKVLRLGADIQQGLSGGFSRTQGIVHVGPSHPAFAGANLAYLNGAKEIEIRGLSDVWKERLKPWFDNLADHPSHPVDVKITLT